ncbi:hypothetical protein C4564_04045 [Candidatus Microgenomates bacterium]|nr:MAG: hypothetical protein C4564_04045 [Candidatus Microgenomates bacterium]
MEEVKAEHHPKFPIVAVAFLVLLLAVVYVLASVLAPFLSKQIVQNPGQSEAHFKKFASNQEFLSYMYAQDSSTGYGIFGGMAASRQALDLGAPVSFNEMATEGSAGAEKINRVSETNIQVQGVDEPDIVKTNGREIYFSSSFGLYFREPFMVEPEIAIEEKVAPAPEYSAPSTKVISAWPTSNIEQIGKIEANGDMLLEGNNLVIFEDNKILGYDISIPESPATSWSFTLEPNTQLTSSRLANGKIYMVTQTSSYSIACPVPLLRGSLSVSVSCTDVYYPGDAMTTDSVFSIIVLNPQTGEVLGKNSFVGLTGQTVIYVSENSAYITVYRTENQTKFIENFLANEGVDLFPLEVRGTITKALALNISDQAKLVELQVIFQNHMNTLAPDARVKLQNDMANKLSDYTAKHARELEHTSIVKLGLGDLSILATGEVPGQVLNQFSIDEWGGNLRIATTVSASQFGVGESVNDVYVLNPYLKMTGSVLDLGRGERVYSARFVGDRGYVVTFRQTDPFYVLDLANPNSPQLTGELKIPGFSSYLHPLSDSLILGVGREDSNVKISLFDVSNPKNPIEASKYTLSEYWTDVQNNHHAFLADSKHNAFFMPAGQKGFVFTYANNTIELVRAVDNTNALRALYINDYLYVLGSEKMVVMSENNWEDVATLTFR